MLIESLLFILAMIVVFLSLEVLIMCFPGWTIRFVGWFMRKIRYWPLANGIAKKHLEGLDLSCFIISDQRASAVNSNRSSLVFKLGHEHLCLCLFLFMAKNLQALLRGWNFWTTLENW